MVNEKADARLSEAVAQAMLEANAEPGGGGFGRTVAEIVQRLARLAADLGNRALSLLTGPQGPATAAGVQTQTLEFRRPDPVSRSAVTLPPSGG